MDDQSTQLLFPPALIPCLQELRDGYWRELVERITRLEPADPDRLAFVLLMVRTCGCASCQADSYRAMQGCQACAVQAIRRFKGSDKEIEKQFEQAREEVRRYQSKGEALE